MAIPSFTQGYPPDGSTLGQTKSTIRNNLDGTFQTIAINHFTQNDLTPGKHTYIQLPSALHPGTTAAGEILLFNGQSPVPGVSNLCYNGSNTAIPAGTVQLTRVEKPTNVQNGFSWLPGNNLISWGFVSPVSLGTAAVSLNTTYASVFSITITPLFTGSSAPSNPTIFVVSNTTTDFTYRNFSSSFGGFYWMAIGK